MKKLVASAVVCVLVISYWIANYGENDSPVIEIETTISINESQEDPIVIQVYHDDTHSELSPGDFRAMFNKSTTSWEKCGVVFELTNDPNAQLQIHWENEILDENGDGSLADAELCGINQESASIALSNNKFPKLNFNEQVETLVHELGHFVCVEHSDNQRSLMYESRQNFRQIILPSDVQQCIDNLPNIYKGTQ